MGTRWGSGCVRRTHSRRTNRRLTAAWRSGKLESSRTPHPRMTTVFVSHSSLDYELVRSRVVAPLEGGGLKVWFSRDAIHGADEWEKRIRQALSGSDWFLVALTPN